MRYNRLNPLHWIVAFFSNSQKSDYLKPGTLHVDETQAKATQRILYWFRNPAADFGQYIIGFDGEPEFKTLFLYGNDDIDHGFTMALRRYKLLILPFVAYGGAWLFYFGWHKSGRFGIKLRRKP